MRPSIRRLLGSGLLAALGSTTGLTTPALARSGGAQWLTNHASTGWAGGAQVLSGDVTIARTGRSLVINVLTPDAVVAFSRFSIRAGGSVTIDELGASSIFVGEVLHGALSLSGALTANGQVVLIDPAGITVGAAAQIATVGLVLSTASPSQAALASVAGSVAQGTLAFDVPGKAGAGIVNHGTIQVSGGSAILAGETVENDGLIAAQFGTVVLAGARTYAVDFSGDGLLRFAAITGAVDQVAAGTAALVDNGGTLAAPGGLVLLTARAAKGILDDVINSSGIVEASSVANVNGTIVLSASGGAAQVSGTLDASGKGAGETGGTIEVLGDQVKLASGARLDVSGDGGGGTALVGGGFHGAGPQPDAAATSVAPGVVIDADALTAGNGGRVAVWSDGATVFDGTVTAAGGAQGGNGGFVETSGKTALTVAGGAVDTLAPHGSTGTWLIDPTNIVVASGTSGAIDPSSIDDANSNVTLLASNNIAFDSAVSINADGVGLTARAGNSIIVAAPITTNGGSIVLSANDPAGPASGSGSIVIDAAVSTAGPDQIHRALVTGGTITLTVNGGSGTVSLGSNLMTASGAVTINAPTVLTGNVEIDPTALSESSGAAIAFMGTIDGDSAANQRTLDLNAGSGSVTLAATIGAQAAVGEIYVGSYGTVALHGSVFTSGSQTYNGSPVELLGAVYQAGGDITLYGPATTGAPTVQLSALDIFAPFAIDGPGALVATAGPHELSNFFSGNIELGPVGATTPLASLTASAANVIALDGSVTTIGSQTYSDQTLYLGGTLYRTSGAPFSQTGATVLGLAPPLSLAEEEDDDDGDGVVDTLGTISSITIVFDIDPAIDTTGGGTRPAGAAISFASPGSIDGTEALTLTAGTSGAISLGALGGTTPLAAVTLAGRSVALAGNIMTASAPVTIDAPVTLDANVEIDTATGPSATGADIIFGGPIDADTVAAGRQLTLDAVNVESLFSSLPVEGNVTFAGTIGATTALGALWVQGDAITLGGSVITSGPQTYEGATIALNRALYQAGGDFTISGNTTIGAAATRISALDISLGAVDGPGSLTLAAGPANFLLGPDFDGFYTFAYSGNIVLGTVGGVTPLASLTATAADAIELGGSVTTSGAQGYTDPTLYLVGTRYQTTGASFSQTGATVLGAPPTFFLGGSDFTFEISTLVIFDVVTTLDPAIDTTGGGTRPAGAAIRFASPGSIDGAEPLVLTAGTSGAISLGTLGGATPLAAVTLTGGHISLTGITTVPAGDVSITSYGSAEPGGTPEPSVAPAVMLDVTLAQAQAANLWMPLDADGTAIVASVWPFAAKQHADAPPLLTILPPPPLEAPAP